jgi:hypothetical protein
MITSEAGIGQQIIETLIADVCDFKRYARNDSLVKLVCLLTLYLLGDPKVVD